MLSTIFIILMFAVVVDFFWLAIKLAWSVGKLILSFIFFPVAMILLAASGLITAALMQNKKKHAQTAQKAVFFIFYIEYFSVFIF